MVLASSTLSSFGQNQDKSKTKEKLSTNCLSFVLFLYKIWHMTIFVVVLLWQILDKNKTKLRQIVHNLYTICHLYHSLARPCRIVLMSSSFLSPPALPARCCLEQSWRCWFEQRAVLGSRGMKGEKTAYFFERLFWQIEIRKRCKPVTSRRPARSSPTTTTCTKQKIR